MDDLTSGGVQLGDTLESALELGEKHEGFVNKCKTVSVVLVLAPPPPPTPQLFYLHITLYSSLGTLSKSCYN